MVNRMRSTRSHTGNRRSHHALTLGGLSTCPNCNALIKRHAMCAQCGMYKGRSIVNVAARVAKKEKKAKAAAKA